MNLNEEGAIRFFISILNRKMHDLFDEEWRNSVDPDCDPILTRWIYEREIKNALKESLYALKKGDLK